jgi:peptidoglycan/xylan/chitin deacetylase (PgdA/CDA1 family)
MAWLTEQAVVKSIDALLEEPHSDELAVSITFDDGYACLCEQALSVLSEFGLSATVYLNTGWIGAKERRASEPSLGHYPSESFMQWSDVERLAEAGWTIGSHGVEHLDLTLTLGTVTDRELVHSRQAIESHLGYSCRHFSYTWGRHSPELRARVAAAGYRYAAASYHAPLRATNDPLAFPRINVARDYTLVDFKAILSGDWDYLGWVQGARALWR